MFQPGQRVLFSDLIGTKFVDEAPTHNKVSVPMPNSLMERRIASAEFEGFIDERCQRGAWTKILWCVQNGSDMWAAYYFENDVDALHFKMRFG